MNFPQREISFKYKEDMNTNMKELNLNEMEQANGGFITLLCALGVVAVGTGLACIAAYATKDSDKQMKRCPKPGF